MSTPIQIEEEPCFIISNRIYLLYIKRYLLLNNCYRKQKRSHISVKPFLSQHKYLFYFTDSTTALKASGLFIAKSARTFLFKSMFLACTLPIKTE